MISYFTQYGIGNHKTCNLFLYPNELTNLTEIGNQDSWVMTHHLNISLYSKKSEQVPLITFAFA